MRKKENIKDKITDLKYLLKYNDNSDMIMSDEEWEKEKATGEWITMSKDEIHGQD